MSEIPDEIFLEILCRLPVLPILRFRCVSKSWKGLIDSPEFVKKHLNQSQKPSSHLNVIIGQSHFYWANLDVFNEPSCYFFQELPHPFKPPSHPDGFKIFGSCDGLLDLCNYNTKDIFLLNPFTRRFHKLPVTGIEFPEKNSWSVYGFGYDCLSDDYKVVRMIQSYDYDSIPMFDSEVRVYSLRSNTWRRIQGFPYWPENRAGVLANGSVHWIVTRKISHKLIAAFDLGTEEYRLVPFLHFADQNIDMLLPLAVLGGCLCVSCKYEMDRFDIWVMKECGFKESWTILFSIRGCDVSYHHAFVRPIEYSKCGRKVLLEDGCNLFWYDLDKRSTYYPIAQLPFGEHTFWLYTCFGMILTKDPHTILLLSCLLGNILSGCILVWKPTGVGSAGKVRPLRLERS